MKEAIKDYYNKLAKEYDNSRFSNSYGQYIHEQEINILNRYVDEKALQANLDLACGTGRFLNYATHGVDVSEEMLKIASAKYPKVNLQVGEGEDLPFDNESFEHVISFHLMMHLDVEQLSKILSEVHRVTKTKGYFIFDIPSEKRRKLTGYSAATWHGGNQISVALLKKMILGKWELINYHGVSFFPLHRIPKPLRKSFIRVDNFLCNTIFKEHASYLVFVLKKT